MVNIRNTRVSKYPNKNRLMFVTGETFRNLIRDDIQKSFNTLYERFGWKKELKK